MRAIRRVDTKPEVALRSALHLLGYRFRKDFTVRVASMKVRPDIVFTRRRVAVFVDGCFWHSCPLHGTRPKSNVGYWSPKLQANAERDERQSASLQANGWHVIRIWEHESVESAIDQIATWLD